MLSSLRVHASNITSVRSRWARTTCAIATGGSKAMGGCSSSSALDVWAPLPRARLGRRGPCCAGVPS